MSATRWKLVWADEFDRDGAPDAEKWAYEIGMLRNFEPQFYTSNRRNARVENHSLILEAWRESMPNPWFDPDSGGWPTDRRVVDFTSANLVTRGKASWTLGRFECRAKVPSGSGVWPAFWMLGENYEQVGWPACGEIDVLEFVGQDPAHIHSTLHFSRGGKHVESRASLNIAPIASDDFHVYATEWFEDRIDFYFDGTRYGSLALHDTGGAFTRPFYLQINLALGGWGGPIESFKTSWKFEIDYVRVYARA